MLGYPEISYISETMGRYSQFPLEERPAGAKGGRMHDDSRIPVDKTVIREIPVLTKHRDVPAPAPNPETPRSCPGAPRRGASTLRWVVRIICLGMLVFGVLTVYHLTEQTVDQTSALSSSADDLAERGAWLVQSGALPAFEDDPLTWAAAHILLASVKFSSHGLSVRQQAHVVEFAFLGGVIALNTLAWMSGWAHRRNARGRMSRWKTTFMYLLAIAACATVSFADQYHKLHVPGRHFDAFDLVLDASGYLVAVSGIFAVWSLGSALYRVLFGR